MSKSWQLVIKIGVSIIALVLAALIIIDPQGSERWLNPTFLLLLAVPLLAFLVPWHRLTSFSAAGVELVLESPSVRGAIEGIKMSSSESRSIRRTLYDLREAIDDSRGSRVLWIDDHPEQILGERRILRALEIQVVSANTSDNAREILEMDDDFDLLISDMQRKSEPESEFGRYGGIEFIKDIRQSSDDPVVKNLPVIFYTAYRPEQVETILDQVSARDLPDIHFCHSIEGLLKEIFHILPTARAEAIRVSSRKVATDI
jgi:CheY-like chemotaxis protein